ncbi:MAG: HlyC/CorC family transporter [Ignavibacteriales bacterium]|nr:HlyC/CorC family transporter [Ignavibacteriales bacterium]
MFSWLFDFFIVMFFVVLNGFFVAAEFAIVKVRMTQIDPLVTRGNWRAKIVKDIITHLDAYLSATQLGITMASLALGWIGEPLIASEIRPMLEGFGITNAEIIRGISFGVAFAIITFLHIVLGELAPKSLAIQRAQQTTLWIASPLKLFYAIFRPIIWSLNSLANAILRLLGFHVVSESELLHSEEELRLLLTQEKSVSMANKNLVLNAMDFRRKQARHSMVSRMEIVALSITAPMAKNLETMRSHKFTRYPVYRESIDNIIGVVNTRDVFKLNRDHDPGFSLESVLRDALFLPETISLERVLEVILQKKNHMVILADEYGGTAGLITLENVLEELVGNIQDEFDREQPEVTKVNENEYLVDASLTTNDVEKLIDQELSPKDILSIGAFLLELLGHIPKKGEVIRVNGTEFTIELVEDKVIERIRVRKLPPPPPAEEEEES